MIVLSRHPSSSSALLCSAHTHATHALPSSRPTQLTPYPAHAFPSENCTTAHFPLHAHFLPPASVLPPSICLSSSSLPSGSPTTTSALHVLSARTRTPEPGPMGPMAWVKGVVGSQAACFGLAMDSPSCPIMDLRRRSVCGSSNRP
jgi:hypothetical protein